MHKLIAVNPAEGVNLPKTVKSKPYHVQTIDTQKTLTLEQIYVLLQASKDTPIHMQILFNVLLGLRRQEINGLKYSDVDYINRTISVERQLGKELNREPYAPNDGATKKELQLKTFSSKRVLPLPDLVFEAIVEERKQYEKNFSMETTFAVQLMENREVRIFTGNTTNSYCRRQDFLIFGGMI